MNIGVVGKGFVGTALVENFKEFFPVEVYDIDETKKTKSLEDLVNWAEIIFVSVPTPMNEDASCNTSIVEDVVRQIASFDKTKKVVIKSTVPPGTTKRLAEETGMNIGFNPEFLTEANFIIDFKYQSLIVLGTEDPTMRDTLATLYATFNSYVKNVDCNIILATSTEAELFKYLANTFLSIKVIYANEIKLLCDKIGANYNTISSIAALDKRLGSTHWKVPGPDGKLGYGGSCFPKDTNALAHFAEANDVPLWLLNEAIYINSQIRED